MIVLLNAATLCNASPTERDADALIASLAKPAPATIEFTEVRFSELLREPLIVSGELGYSGATSMDRRVTTPYREYAAIRGESVKVEREGKKPRTFALKHAPELRALLTGFSALLAGDAAALRQAFSVRAKGDGDTWKLELRPTEDTKAQLHMYLIEVIGSHTEPRCFTMRSVDRSYSVLLLGAAAKEPLPKDVSEKELYKRCGFNDGITMAAPARH